MDGRALVRSLRVDGADRRPTLICVSAGEQDAEAELRDAGIDAFLLKPFAMADLVASIEAVSEIAFC